MLPTLATMPFAASIDLQFFSSNAAVIESAYAVIDDLGNELTPTQSLSYKQVMQELIVLRQRVSDQNVQLENANQTIEEYRLMNESLSAQIEDLKKCINRSEESSTEGNAVFDVNDEHDASDSTTTIQSSKARNARQKNVKTC